MVGKVIVYQMFSEARIQLVKEVNKNPPLVYILQKMGGEPSWEEQLAEIAAYCFIVVDGAYTPDDLEGLYEMLIKSLREKSVIVLPGNDTIN